MKAQRFGPVFHAETSGGVKQRSGVELQLDPQRRALELELHRATGGVSRASAPGQLNDLLERPFHLAERSSVELLRARGHRNFWVQAGGDHLAGKNGARPWSVGIRDPRGPPNQTFAKGARS